MFELNATDQSLLSWVLQSTIPAHALSIQFHPGSLVVHCQSLDDAMKLWETRSLLTLSGRELCFRVEDVLYVGAALGA